MLRIPLPEYDGFALCTARRVLRRIFHETHDLARCSKWAHCPAALRARAHRAHFSSACARVQTNTRVLDVLVVVVVLEFSLF